MQTQELVEVRTPLSIGELVGSLQKTHHAMDFAQAMLPQERELLDTQIKESAVCADHELSIIQRLFGINIDRERVISALRILPKEVAAAYSARKYGREVLGELPEEVDTFHYYSPGSDENFIYLFPPLTDKKEIDEIRNRYAETEIHMYKYLKKRGVDQKYSSEAEAKKQVLDKSEEKIVARFVESNAGGIRYGLLRYLGLRGIERGERMTVVHKPFVDHIYIDGQSELHQGSIPLSKLAGKFIEDMVKYEGDAALLDKIWDQRVREDAQTVFASWIVPILRDRYPGGLYEATKLMGKEYFQGDLDHFFAELSGKTGVPKERLEEAVNQANVQYEETKSQYGDNITEWSEEVYESVIAKQDVIAKETIGEKTASIS